MSQHDLQARPRVRPSWITCLAGLGHRRISCPSAVLRNGFGALEAPRVVPSFDPAVEPLIERRLRQVRFGRVATQ